jgi:tRNA 2-thiocytidine biosynthesis protein TtcA
LAYVPEKYLERYALQQDFPIIPCNLCGSQENLQRNAMKALLKDWEKQHPGRVASIFRAVTQVVPSHLLDSKLFDFKNISTGEFADSVPGDRAIDEGFNEPCQPADETLQLIHILA